MKTLLFFILMRLAFLTAQSQPKTLSLEQQKEDFKIFKGSLQEGHSGLYYFIDQTTFDGKCDSIQKTFQENETLENYYLKLRFLITLLNHGHTRLNPPTKGNVNYKMAILDSTKLYLPFEFIIINNQLIIKEDCSNEQLFPKYAVVKSINGVKSKDLITKMLAYIPADGINQTFKYYNLYNYYYFHHLFNLFYPDKKGISIVLESDKRNYVDYYIELLKPRTIENNYFKKNKKSISSYDKQLGYHTDLPKKTAYLRVSSFYKGLIENFGQKYEPFLDSAFADIKTKKLENLILDLRDNEGGGDDYDKILVRYLSVKPTKQAKSFAPSRQFNFIKYAINVPEDLKNFIANPNAFLKDETSLELKASEPQNFPIPSNNFTGKIVILTNGGSFSASTFVVSVLYEERKNTNRKIFFVGEENGGDIYCNTLCAGLSYNIKLPNSAIVVDMPLICFDELKKDYPKKRLPDYEVFPTIKDLKNNKDTVLDFATKKCQTK
jgi:hypothetical protein